MTPYQDQLWTLLILSGYFLPTIIAWVRAHPATNGIFVINLLLGWTFIFWVLSLAWSVIGGNQHHGHAL